jgi:FtsP/CotA-like multicopper oxidase with cupredoxin domain
MNRRQFLSSLLLSGSAVSVLPICGREGVARASTNPAQVLKAVSRNLDVNGRAAKVFGRADKTGRHGLTFTEGDQFIVARVNQLSEPTIVHWHGLRPPYDQDGVPNMPLPMLGTGEIRHYDFPVGAGGTHWMHAHTLQEQNLLAAPLIVRDKDADKRDEQEVVVLFHDFSFTSADELLAGLTKRGGMPGRASLGGTSNSGGMSGMDMSNMNMAEGIPMPLTAMDLNDIDYDAYLANDRTLDDPEVVTIEKGARVRLRLINGAAATAFTIDTGPLNGELIAVDGHAIEPIVSRRFPIAMGQRLDIRLTLPPNGKSYLVLALREGASELTGIILAPAGATVSRIAKKADQNSPALDLSLEMRLRAKAPLAPRPADKTLTVMLMGDMQTYKWSLVSEEPLSVRSGQRVRIGMMNHTMMAHPMHLHGHPFQVVEINSVAISGAIRDTVLLPPMAKVAIEFDADHPGKWAFHCHHLYHMVTGMMSTVEYESLG